MEGIRIILNETERRLAQFLTKRREDQFGAGYCRTHVANHDRVDARLQSIGAELAFCRVFNLYPSMDVDVKGTMLPYDAMLHDGTTVDVKHTTCETGRLLSRKGSISNADVFVLVVGELPAYRIVGFAYRSDVIDSTADLGYGETHAIRQSDLMPLSILGITFTKERM